MNDTVDYRAFFQRRLDGGATTAELYPDAKHLLGPAEATALLGPEPSKADVEKARRVKTFPSTNQSRPRGGEKIRLDCIYRHEQIDLVKCPSCCGNAWEKVFRCDVHSSCSILRDVGSKVCADCNEYLKK